MTAHSQTPLVFIDGKRMMPVQPMPQWFGREQICLFESMCVVGQAVFRLEQHIDRLFSSAKTVHFRVCRSRRQIQTEIRTALRCAEKKTRYFLRLTVSETHLMIFLLARPRLTAAFRSGIDITTSSVKRNLSNAFPPEVKCNQFLNNLLPMLEPVCGKAFETLFLNSDGGVCETRVRNFFMIKNRRLLTPPAAGILNGVTRCFVIECAQKERFSFAEEVITRHDAWNADEAFATSTSGEIVPVRSLDNRRIGMTIPGPATRKLYRRFQYEFKREIKTIS